MIKDAEEECCEALVSYAALVYAMALIEALSGLRTAHNTGIRFKGAFLDGLIDGLFTKIVWSLVP
jgi:hypothetical protein